MYEFAVRVFLFYGSKRWREGTVCFFREFVVVIELASECFRDEWDCTS